MRDDRNKWPAAIPSARPALIRDGISVQQVSVTRQTILSGGYEDCLKLSGLNIAFGGGSEKAVGETYALRQRRDRILLVNGPAMADGWHSEQNVAVSDMTAAYAIIELSGGRVEQLIATGTEFIGNGVSPSVSRLWHSFGVLLYRYGVEDTYRMHIRSAFLDSAWEMLERQISGLTKLWAEDTIADVMANEIHGAKLECKEAG